MGSFNTSCFVTKQVIKPNQKVVIFPICALLNGNGWEVMGSAITAVYIDYGMYDVLETTENIEALFNLYTMLKNKVKFDSEYNFLNSIDLKKLEDLDTNILFNNLSSFWADINDKIVNGKLKILIDRVSRDVQISVMSIHTFDYILNSNKIIKVSPSQYYEYYINKDIKKFLRMCNDGLYVNNPKLPIEYLITEFFISHFEFNTFPIEFLYTRNKVDCLYKMYVEGELIKSEHIYGLMKYYYDIYYVMEAIKKIPYIKFEPQVYTGQDYYNEIGLNYMEMVKGVNLKLQEEI